MHKHIIDYSGGSIAGRALGFGSKTFVTARTELLDKDSGNVLIRANVRGRSESVAHGGDNDLAQGYTRGFMKLIAQHHSKIEAVKD